MKTKDISPNNRRIIIIILWLIAIILYLTVPHEKFNETIKHLLLVFSVILSVHLLDVFFLNKDIENQKKKLIEETIIKFNPILTQANKCGLVNIYESRNAVKDEIINAIKNSNNRIWMLGVSFSEDIKLDDIIDLLADDKKSKNFDIKILLLNALCSPAIFRCFLEIESSKMAEIINFQKQIVKTTDNPFFHTRLYNDFSNACSKLDRYSNLKSSVRFYSHSPNCWLIAIDDTIFFQPYTFGKSEKRNRRQENLCLGSYMPVFKFKKFPDLNSDHFEIFEDHFKKLWITSDTDLFHINAQIEDRETLVKMIFRKRKLWLESVSGILSIKDKRHFEKDLREFPRQPCRSTPPLQVKWAEKDESIKKAVIKNFSRKGMCVELHNSSTTLKINDIINVDLDEDTPAKTMAAKYISEKLTPNNKLIVKNIEERIEIGGKRSNIIRLQDGN